MWAADVASGRSLVGNERPGLGGKALRSAPKFSGAVTAEAGRLLCQPPGALTRSVPVCTGPVHLFQAALTRGAPVPHSSVAVAARRQVTSCRICSSHSRGYELFSLLGCNIV
jgi:hypothetical protein